MLRTALALAGALACLSTQAFAQSPIPERRVPGFGGTDSKPTTAAPSASGTAVGSNVGAGATAAPETDEGPSKGAPSIAETPPSLLGVSRSLPLSR